MEYLILDQLLHLGTHKRQMSSIASSVIYSDVRSKSKACVQLVDLDAKRNRMILVNLSLRSSNDMSTIASHPKLTRDCLHEKFVLAEERNSYGTEYLEYIEIYNLVDLFSRFDFGYDNFYNGSFDLP